MGEFFAFVLWPLLKERKILWFLPMALVLLSLLYFILETL